MRIERLEVWEVELPFRFTFAHANAARSSSRNLVVGVELEGRTIGYGEGVPREYVTGETPASAWERIRDEYAPALIGRELDPADPVAGIAEMGADLHHGRAPAVAAWCAVETALLDAAGRASDQPVSAFFGGVARPEVRYSGVIPFGRGGLLAGILVALRLYGFSTVKLKVGRGEDVDIATARLARRILGTGVELRADVNCAWTAEETLRMAERLRPYGVRSYEQPVPAEDLAGLRRLTAELPEDVIVDESACSLADAERLVAERACNVFNVRVSKCGGLLGSLAIARLAREAGLSCQLGAQVGESGILTATGLVLATIAETPEFRYLEGWDNCLLLQHGLTHESLIVRPGGRARAPTGSGIGVRVDPARLGRLAQQHVTVPAESRVAAQA